MVAGCGSKILKYSLFSFNLIFVLAGLASVAVGIWLAVDTEASARIAKIEREYKNQQSGTSTSQSAYDLKNLTRDAGIFLIVAGSIILVIAFLGCCGAVKEWRPLLVMYAVCLLIILGIEIAAAIYAGVNRNQAEDSVKKWLRDSLALYNGSYSAPNGVRAAWDRIMLDDKCCLVDSDAAMDFASNTVWKTRYPGACCNDKNVESCEAAKKFPDGCYKVAKENLMNQISVVIGVGVGIGLLQLIGILVAFCLCCAITSDAGNMA